MKHGKKILAILLTAMITIGLCGISVIADTDTKALGLSDYFYVQSSKITTLNKKLPVITTASGRNAFLMFDTSGLSVAEGTIEEYVANTPRIMLSMAQTALTDDFINTVFGIENSKTSYSSTNSAFTKALYDAGTEIGTVSGEGKVSVSLDVTDYVKAQTDGLLVFRIKGDVRTTTSPVSNKAYSSLQFKFNNFSLVFDYSDEAKLASAKNAIELNESYSEDFELPTAGKFDSVISWESDSEAIEIDEDGFATVTRPQDADASVTLTATITIGENQTTKQFTVTVPKVLTGDVLRAVSEADIYVQNGYSTNYNYMNKFYINGSGRQNFVRFRQEDMAQEEIANAKLYLYFQSTGDTAAENTVSMYGLTGNEKIVWDESLVADTAVEQGLLDFSAEPYGTGTYMGVTKLDNLSEAHWVCIDVTDYVKSQSDGVYAMRFYGAAVKANFASREVAGFEPYLEISRGDTGAVRSDAEVLKVAECVYDSITLPTSGANGSAITWESDNAAIDVSGENVQVAKVTEKTEVVLTASVTKGAVTETKTFSVNVLPSRFTFSQDGEEISAIGTGTVTVGIAEGLTLPENSNLFIALYGADGRLDSVEVFHQAARIELTMDGAQRIAVFVWDKDLKPIDTKSIRVS